MRQDPDDDLHVPLAAAGAKRRPLASRTPPPRNASAGYCPGRLRCRSSFPQAAQNVSWTASATANCPAAHALRPGSSSLSTDTFRLRSAIQFELDM